MSLVPGEMGMVPASLRSISTEQTCDFLMRRVWKRCPENPFSSMPTAVVEGLFACMVRRHQIVRSRLLLTSGRLERVDLHRARHFRDYVPLLRMLSDSCQTLRTLSLPGYHYRKSGEPELALNALLFNNPNLEELHSNIPCNPMALGNCRKLRRLEMHFDERAALGVVSYFAIEPQLLGSMEVLSLCRKIDPELMDDCLLTSIAILLDECPLLTSMGYLDSSMALKKLHDRDSDGPGRRFQLRKGSWEAGNESTDFGYCERIRVAALACPLLDTLVIEVRDAGCLRHLKALKNLTSLSVYFQYSEKQYEREFYSLLEDIGSQLRHLCVSDDIEEFGRSLHVNRMCNSCPNLRILRFCCALTGDKASVDLPYLERLSVIPCDRQTLPSLLTGCLRLRVLCLGDSESLDDGLLQSILRKNPFEELELALIDCTSLSASGLEKLVRSARRLRKLYFQSFSRGDGDATVRRVRELNPMVDCRSSYNFNKCEVEEFPLFFSGCFL